MNDSKISVRYARALFDSAAEQGVLEEVVADMKELQEICTIADFQFLLENPVMKESQKNRVLEDIFSKKVHPLTSGLLKIVVKNGREIYIPAISRNFIDMYKREKGIRTAVFTTASPIPDTVKTRVEKIIMKALNSPVELKTLNNEDIIGGFILRLDDKQYDASVSTSLRNIRKQLLK